jgi:hypothetical protein
VGFAPSATAGGAGRRDALNSGRSTVDFIASRPPSILNSGAIAVVTGAATTGASASGSVLSSLPQPVCTPITSARIANGASQ